MLSLDISPDTRSQVHNDPSGSCYVNDANLQFQAVVLANTWITLGPTGSGAGYIWTAMDALPAGINWLALKHHTWFSASSWNGSVWLDAKYPGTTPDPGNVTIGGFSWNVGAAEPNPQHLLFDYSHVPVDPVTRQIELRWRESNSGGPQIMLHMMGYGWNR